MTSAGCILIRLLDMPTQHNSPMYTDSALEIDAGEDQVCHSPMKGL